MGLEAQAPSVYFFVLRAGLGQWLPKAPLFAQNGHGKYKFIELQNW